MTNQFRSTTSASKYIYMNLISYLYKYLRVRQQLKHILLILSVSKI